MLKRLYGRLVRGTLASLFTHLKGYVTGIKARPARVKKSRGGHDHQLLQVMAPAILNEVDQPAYLDITWGRGLTEFLSWRVGL